MSIYTKIARSAKQLRSTRALTMASMLVALHVALSSVRVMITPELRLGIGFVTQAAVGMMFGPVMAMLTGVAGDLVSHICFPSGGFFPGYTLTALVGGLIYGLLLYDRPHIGYMRALLAKGMVSLVCNVVLNTCWLMITSGQALAVLLPMRFLKNVCLLPLEGLMIYMTASALALVEKRAHIKNKARD